LLVVKLKVRNDSKAISERSGEQALPGRGAYHSELWNIQPDRSSRWTLPDHNVDFTVFHRRVKDFLDRTAQPMYLVDEEYGTRLEVGQNSDQISWALNCGSACHVYLSGHFRRDNMGKRCFSESGRAVEEDVIQCFLPLPCGGQKDGQIVLQLFLTDKLAQASRSEAEFTADIIGGCRRVEFISASHKSV
jgi:hypothetical protein